MATTVDELQVIVTAEVDKAIKDLQKLPTQNKKVESSFKSMAKVIGGAAVTGVILKSFVSISLKSSELASDAEEIRSKFKVVFGDAADDVSAWASSYSESVGRSETDTLSFLGVIGDTLKPLGFTGDAVEDLSQQVVALAGDLGSFNNIPTQEVVEGIQSALVGNVETLRRYGVVANEAAIKQEALNSGLWDGEGAISAQEKAQAILNITLAGTQDAQGDLLRTQESAANVTASLNSTLKETAEIYGDVVNKGLTPLKAAVQEELAGINTTIKAYFLKNKVIAGEATLIEKIVNKQNELNKALEAQSAQNEGEISQRERLEALRNGAIEQYIGETEGLEKLVSSFGNVNRVADSNVATLERQIDALKRKSGEEQAAVDILDLLNDTTKINTEENEGNVESKEAIIELTEAQIEADAILLRTLREQQFLKEDLATQDAEDKAKQIDDQEEANAKLEEYNNTLKETEISATALAQVGLQSMTSGFETLGEAIASGTVSIATFGDIATEALASVLRALGGELAARAAVSLLFGDVAGAALAGAGSAAAYTAAGIASAAFAEGGSFETNGAQNILVGDNPGGVEKVTVEPVSSAGANESFNSGGGNMTLNIDGDQFTAWIQNKFNNRAIRVPRGSIV